MIGALSTPLLLLAFGVAGAVVVVASVRATALADMLADRTRLGEALAGGLILGGATSLSGIIVSTSGAWSGDASFAFSNAIGGIAAQTLFLALADVLHRDANLEHSAAQPENLVQAVMLIILLSLTLLGIFGPDVAVLGIHPVSVVLFLAYLTGLRISGQVSENPMWTPVQTHETRRDEPEDSDERHRSAKGPALAFLGLVALLGTCGLIIGQAGGAFIARFGLGSSLVGALITAVVTSLPELVTTLAAVRRGALQLAVGGIIGGNTFDSLFLVFADAAYRDGSLYHALARDDVYWLATGLVMTSVLLAGLVFRQKHGPGRIGLDGVLMIGVYACAVAAQVISG
ncbi:sodium:calcium antiporter [Roseovarius sp. MMSF_3281]|uniref:sodium:calcium antiporter n=1 Tax=Roseovarius sp. MMSF_3281 TaxID=3046694 RepID=UPI00273D771D|nr:sodium:calcium antiporter [Roseovarius sp. MMSF_3281]